MSNICVISQNNEWQSLLEQHADYAAFGVQTKAVEEAYDGNAALYILDLEAEEAERWLSSYEGKAAVILLLKPKAEARFRLLSTRWSEEKGARIEMLVLPIALEQLFDTMKQLLAHKSTTVPSDKNQQKWHLSARESTLTKAGKTYMLTEKEVLLLEALLARYPEAVDKQTLLKEVWEYGKNIDTHTLETHVYRLRQKINDPEGVIITTEEGYKLKGF